MGFRQKLALHVAPIPLRVMLAAVFIYTGWGKVFYSDMPVAGEAAATLANLGLLEAVAAEPAEVPEQAPASEEEGAPGDIPAEEAPAADEPPAEPAEEGEPSEPAEESAQWTGGVAIIAAQNGAGPGAAPMEAEPAYAAEDFPEPIDVSRRMGIVLLMAGAAERGQLPEQLSGGTTLNVLAWMAALTEFVGGWLLLLGFLTRLWAMGMAGTMVVAMWLTQIGPALGTDTAFLGFLPELAMDDPDRWITAWKTLLWQLSLLGSSLALFLLGPGALSLDALLMGPKASSIGERQKAREKGKREMI